MHHIMYCTPEWGGKKRSERGGCELNCCKIWPRGKHDIIYWSHIMGVKVLVIVERGLLLVIMIPADVGGRDTEEETATERERWKPRATSKSVPAIPAWDHHTITKDQLKTLPASCPFTLNFSAAEADGISALSKYSHCLRCSSFTWPYTLIHTFNIMQHTPVLSLITCATWFP